MSGGVGSWSSVPSSSATEKLKGDIDGEESETRCQQENGIYSRDGVTLPAGGWWMWNLDHGESFGAPDDVSDDPNDRRNPGPDG